MKISKQKIYNSMPWELKNILITMFNIRFIFTHGKEYRNKIKEIDASFFEKDFEKIKKNQENRFLKLINFAKKYNDYYRNKLKDLEINSLSDIKKAPILSKIDFANMSYSKSQEKKIIGFTGGSTGISTKFYMFKSDYIERIATIDFFRGLYGYKFKKNKIGWFSGKEIITNQDVERNRFWVKDYINKITYFSTFHIKKEYIIHMIEEINNSKLEFLAGFPSAIYDIAYIWEQEKIPLKTNIQAIFPTSEPLDARKREFLENFFDCKVPNQYSSSEGAPFIYECPHGILHYDMNSGIFEIENDKLLVTSFVTRCMPLVRFDIGDVIEFESFNFNCACGSKMPHVKSIIGRTNDYLYSPERGKITVSNISNIVKYLKDIRKFKIIQNDIDYSIVVKYISDINHDAELERELRYRLGENIKISFERVKEFEKSKNGKFKMIEHIK